MPLQTTFGSKITTVATVAAHPLGTIRVEGDKTYKYMKAGGVIHAPDGCAMSASGTVVVTAANLKASGVNASRATLASGDYFWMQVAGEMIGDATVSIDTSGSTAVGYPAYCTDATGLLSGTAAGGTIIGTSTVAVKHATLGAVMLSGLL